MGFRTRLTGIVFAISITTTMVLALTVLTGWYLDIQILKSLHPDGVSMKTNAAVAFVLSAAGLLLLKSPSPTRGRIIASRFCALIVTLLGVLTLSQYLGGWNLKIDELLFAEERGASNTSSPNRMAPTTALEFSMVGIALFLRSRPGRKSQGVGQGFAIAVAVLGYMAILGYIYGASSLYWLPHATAMAAISALSSIFLAVAFLCSQPGLGLVKTLSSEGPGGQLARRQLPAVVLIPSFLGLLTLAGEAIGFYDTAFGAAALVAATIVLFAGVTWRISRTLDQLDSQRSTAMNRVEAESRARELERSRLRAVLDVLPVGVFLADKTGRLEEINESAKAIWGKNPPLVAGVPEYTGYRARWSKSRELVKPEEWGLARSLAHGEVCLAQEVEIQPFDGEPKTILNYTAPIRDEHGDIAGGVAVNVDITERKLAEMELQTLKNELEKRVRGRTVELAAANAELEAFSYSVSHDLRAPLRWVDGFTLALAEEYAEKLDDTGRDYIKQIRESVKRMSELIDALLKLARITRAPLERADEDLSQVAREIASRLVASSATPRRVTWEIADNLHAVADPNLVHIVLDNLLRNAFKFTQTRETARIQVGAMECHGERVFFVKDNGVGFDMAYSGKLFRSFERLHRADEFEGTGIGLALVHRVVQRHGGAVWADGRLNEGATFFFTLGPSQVPS